MQTVGLFVTPHPASRGSPTCGARGSVVAVLWGIVQALYLFYGATFIQQAAMLTIIALSMSIACAIVSKTIRVIVGYISNIRSFFG